MSEEVTQPVDLPEDLALPLASGAPHWYWIGGSPAIDLVNTLRERWRRRVECLVHGDDLAAWLVRAGLLAAPPAARPAAARVREARALREAVDAAIAALVEGRQVPVDAIAAVDRALAWAPRPALRAGPDGPRLDEDVPGDPVRAALGRIALDAARILGGPDRERLRICGADDCSARFLDRSPAGRRRWCSMAGCGNRAKVRRHRARAEPAATAACAARP